MPASALINSQSAQVWRAYHDAYPAALDARIREISGRRHRDYRGLTLRDDDEWIWNTLPGIVKQRSPPHLNKDELSRVIKWKMTRGEWRIGLQSKAESNKEDVVKNATSRAYGLLANNANPSLDDIIQAVKLLSDNAKPEFRLDGVGPVTATAILATISNDVPYLSDELIREMSCSTAKYDIATVTRIIEKVYNLVSSLSQRGIRFNARMVEKALFSSDVAKRVATFNVDVPDADDGDIPEAENTNRGAEESDEDHDRKKKRGREKHDSSLRTKKAKK
ncbi:hypothetical protein SeMB42_g02612 [Synchytrium endobioticum]|uniref:Uncharacterized protein n=1 Tax=Synchytrium endobioticum TaxID=286115 RepID=A0A507CYE6_9FUNG|nr:hypothetical protein SeLEV6574_g04619 [Synchytrium endobioticum]TPX49390.1 hypothetical protein SeMB42_g02612 [Synchytrium endobioticum]